MPLRNLLVIALTIIISLACYSVASKNRYANLFAEAMDVIDRQSLREIPREQLFVSAMEGMMEDLDEHSMYISGDMFKGFDEDIRQEFGGVGMYVESDRNTKRLFVLAPMPDTPAYEAGLRAGDQIATIDGEDTAGLTRRDAVKLLRGPVGSPVELEIQRGDQLMKKSLRRAIIEVASVNGDFRDDGGNWQYVLKDNPRIGYIRLIQFGEKSAEEMAAAVKEIGSDIDGLIIDLRNNSGGLLDVAIEICDMFLPGELAIVRTLHRNKVVGAEYFSTARLDLRPNVPICILVNRNSASASEIMAGCLQDHGRAIIIGEQTWGKGTVQNVIPIQRNKSALKLTTASYWRPSGKSIDRNDEVSKETQKWGVQPDENFLIELTKDEVFENIRQRNARDLQGLMTPEESKVVSEMRANEAAEGLDGDQEGEPENPPLPDEESEEKNANDDPSSHDLRESKPIVPHVDEPLQRAIEYFKSLEQRKRIAA